MPRPHQHYLEAPRRDWRRSSTRAVEDPAIEEMHVLLALLDPRIRGVLLTARPARGPHPHHRVARAPTRLRWDLLIMRPWGRHYDLSRTPAASVWDLREYGSSSSSLYEQASQRASIPPPPRTSPASTSTSGTPGWFTPFRPVRSPFTSSRLRSRSLRWVQVVVPTNSAPDSVAYLVEVEADEPRRARRGSRALDLGQHVRCRLGRNERARGGSISLGGRTRAPPTRCASDRSASPGTSRRDEHRADGHVDRRRRRRVVRRRADRKLVPRDRVVVVASVGAGGPSVMGRRRSVRSPA